MASTTKVFVSPGVYTSERDLTFVAQSVGVTTLGIVGETLQGPAFEPIFITNFDEYQVYFGGTSPEKFINTQIPKYETSYIAKAYLQQSNQLFVTRVLGLSGYDAGPSWSITTIGNPDPSTVGTTGTTTSYTLSFSGTSGSSSNVTITSPSSLLSSIFYNAYTKFNGTTSTLNADFQSFISTAINNYVNVGTGSTGGKSVFWGTVTNNTFTAVTATTLYSVPATATTNTLGVDNIILENADLTSTSNDPWYYSLFSYSKVGGQGSYYGFGFGAAINSFGTGATSNTFTGTCTIKATNYSGTPFSDYDDLVVATLRSRGITTYSSDDGPVYQVSGTSNAIMVCSGVYSGLSKNPYNTFVISGITKDSNTFSFETSLQTSDSKYISKVFGRSNFSKDRTQVPLFVEEVYSSLLLNGYREGKVRGIYCSFLDLPGARSGDSDTIGFYLEQYQTPETPYLVSELRGNRVYKLFKFKLISDGNAANRLVKISIGNISFNNGTFDIFVRDFFDTDQNVRVIESFTNCSMDPSQNNFVANKVGTTNGEYQLNSKYIMLELSDEYPVDALPCGFEGYISREYERDLEASRPPFLVYKTKYLKPGDVVYNPPFGSSSGVDDPVISTGENPRRAYLGVSNITGIDYDFFDYKGKQLPLNIQTDTTGAQWGYLTKGFHMDSGATIVTIPAGFTTAGESAFEVGRSSFNSEPQDSNNDYFKLNTRKFTLFPYGGFDGWDIYREYRTNNDRFQLGQAGYKKGAASSASYPTATGWGAFKQITGPNQEVWANTDYYAYLWGQTTFSNPEAVNINVFTTPGIDYVNNSNLVESAIDIVETDRADSIYICTTPDFNLFLPSFNDITEGLIYPDEVVDNLESTGIDSNYTATYYPWLLTRDTVNNTQIYLPPTAEVTKNLALTDNIAFPWFASAGYTRGLVTSIKARRKLTQDDRDTLYKGRINPIATFSDVGTVIWGNKTLQIRESALDRINVRRLLLQARKLISAVAVRLLFEQNDEKVRQDFLDAVNPILDSIRRDRGLIDFRVTVSNTPEDLDSNTLTGKIFLKPTRALEYIDIEFVITPTGASFDDV
jgi:hypothetical protein